MAEKENSCPLTRAQAKKRSADVLGSAPMVAWNKKRVTVTGISVISDAESSRKTSLQKKKEEKKMDVDSDDEDPLLCSQIDGDIHTYLRKMEAEVKRRPAVNYIQERQKDVTSNMREILVDWLVEVAAEYKLGPDSLYRTVSYIDRFLSVNQISRHKLQLLGVSAMLIAAKYEEITPPKVEDFCYITDNTYTKQEVVKTEADILKLLNFEMGSPTTKTFLRRYSRAGEDDSKYSSTKLEYMAEYIAELSLLEYRCLQFLPSKIAASAVFLSRFALEPSFHPWSSKLQQQTSYNPSELRDCITILYSLLLNEKKSSLCAIRDKYKLHRFKCVSALELHNLPSKIPESHFHGF